MRELTKTEIENAPDWATDFAIIKGQVIMIGGGQITKTEGQKVLWSEVFETDFEPIPGKKFDVRDYDFAVLDGIRIDDDNDIIFCLSGEYGSYVDGHIVKQDAIALAKHFKLTAEDLR